MAFATAEELRVRRRLPVEGFDTASADQVLAGVSAVVRAAAGERHVAALEQHAPSANALAVAKEITLQYAAKVHANPEAVMQRRLGADQSISYADSSEAAVALSKSDRRALRSAFQRDAYSVAMK